MDSRKLTDSAHRPTLLSHIVSKFVLDAYDRPTRGSALSTINTGEETRKFFGYFVELLHSVRIYNFSDSSFKLSNDMLLRTYL